MDTLRELAAVLRDVTGEDERWAAAVTPESRLEDDLRLESVEVAALGEALRARWGVDLPAYLAGLDLDELIDLSVGDLARLVSG
ncbi:acyl carrier protein [Phytohabitans kaempferiae]|uniref:Acyl carrier protein n=1 Tax=Phytohabitans kaempferiae TaxID=1620943 RepID=A0ABV6M888_9ACTN